MPEEQIKEQAKRGKWKYIFPVNTVKRMAHSMGAKKVSKEAVEELMDILETHLKRILTEALIIGKSYNKSTLTRRELTLAKRSLELRA